jgi:hypothetical protein
MHSARNHGFITRSALFQGFVEYMASLQSTSLSDSDLCSTWSGISIDATEEHFLTTYFTLLQNHIGISHHVLELVICKSSNPEFSHLPSTLVEDFTTELCIYLQALQ